MALANRKVSALLCPIMLNVGDTLMLFSYVQTSSTDTSAPAPDATATRVIRSLHLTRAQK